MRLMFLGRPMYSEASALTPVLIFEHIRGNSWWRARLARQRPHGYAQTQFHNALHPS
jgi:hypothetical protein